MFSLRSLVRPAQVIRSEPASLLRLISSSPRVFDKITGSDKIDQQSAEELLKKEADFKEGLVHTEPEEKAMITADRISGAPAEMTHRSVRIYKPTKTTMQSGRAGFNHWRIDFDTLQGSGRWINPLMGWASSADYMQGMTLKFKTEEEAVLFAEKQGWDYVVSKPNVQPFKPKAYAENYVHSPGKLRLARTNLPHSRISPLAQASLVPLFHPSFISSRATTARPSQVRMDSVNLSFSPQARSELNLLPINTSSRSKSSSRSGSRSGSNSPRSFQGRQSYLSSVNGHRVSSPILISPGSTENFQPPSYSPRPPPLERQDTSLSLSYYYSSTGAGGLNSPVYTTRSISSSSLYSPELSSPAKSGFGGNSGGEDGSRFLSSRPMSSSAMMPTRSSSRGEPRMGREEPSAGSLSASESLASISANIPATSSSLNTSEFGFIPPNDPKKYDSPTTSLRSSSTSSRKGTITKFFRQSRQASPVADDQLNASPANEPPQRTSLSIRDRSSTRQGPSRSPSSSSQTARQTGDASPLGFKSRQASSSQEQQLSQAQSHSLSQQVSNLNPSALASRPLPIPDVLRTSPQEEPLKTEDQGNEEWATDIINELAMDSDSDNAVDAGDRDDQTNEILTKKLELQSLGSEPDVEVRESENKRATRDSSRNRRKGAYRDHPPAPLINSWSTKMPTAPSGFLAEDESSPVSPESDYYRSASSSPQIPLVRLKGSTTEHETGGASALLPEDKPSSDDTDTTPRIQQVSQMDESLRTSIPSRERDMGLARVEDDLRSPQTENYGTDTVKTEAETGVETEAEGYQSESSFDDGTQPVRRQRQSTEYWDPILSPEASSWFKENAESFKPKAKTITDNAELSSSSDQANKASEGMVGNSGRATGLSAARERAAKAKTAYLASLPNAVDASGSTVRSATQLIPTLRLPSISDDQSQLMVSPTSNMTEPISHEPRDSVTSTVLDNNHLDLSLSSSTSPSSGEPPMSGMKRTFSRASGLGGSIEGPVSLDLQADVEIEEEHEDGGRLDRSRDLFVRSSRTPSTNDSSLSSSGHQYSHSKQLSTATIRPLSPPPSLPQIPGFLSGATDSTATSSHNSALSEPPPVQSDNKRHSLSHARTLEELTAAVDRAINDTDDPPNFDLRTDFGVVSSSQEFDPQTDGNETTRHLTRSESITSEASTWGDHAPPLTISINPHDSVELLDQESDYVLVESPSFPPPGEIYIPGDLVNLQRRPSHRGSRTSAPRDVPIGPSLSVSSSTTLSELPSNIIRDSEPTMKVHTQQNVSLPPSMNSSALTNARQAATNMRQPLESGHNNNYSILRASQSGTSQPARSLNKVHAFAPMGQWPKAMVFSDVKSVKSSGDRASMYARKINELSRADTGLGEWIKIVGGHRGQIKSTGILRHQKPDEHLTDRKVSAASAVSDEAFPLRSSGPSFQVQQIRNVSPPSGAPPPNLPYPQLAQGVGMRSSPSVVSLKSVSSRPSMSNSIANVAQGSGGFFQTLGRRGSISAGSSGGGSSGGMKGIIGGRTKSPPGVVIEDTGGRHEGRSSVSPMKGLIGGSSKTGNQKLTGPRSRNLSRTPSISNPINLNNTPPLPPRRSVDLDHQIQNRHVLFPIPQRASLSDIPSPRPASLDYPIDVNFDKNLREMVGILKEEDQNVLAGYLRRANGSIPNAIGSFLEDQSRESII
ncbi:NADH:ubiquinone oxidoreductase, NDUFS4/18 kDa subunit [Phaffia rhodozyma]|uniref:NADH:ubiquinone oxidoreductase, NDUFS4/18 kDa subunit n=1 Tax=Phaffia rhodozyma TaxID=264483 RepID=A0A0F7SJN4_PHARH|nr:NADH:ubiquinone oxidoreductase, NDUFS4/18 kDa subunit [Phaffia rhodozyma]